MNKTETKARMNPVGELLNSLQDQTVHQHQKTIFKYIDTVTEIFNTSVYPRNKEKIISISKIVSSPKITNNFFISKKCSRIIPKMKNVPETL